MSTNSPTSTLINCGWDIVVPNNQFGSVPCVFKVYFGKKYFIWKGKALLQSCELLAKSIRAALNKGLVGTPVDETHYMYHVIAHIKKARVSSATVEVVSSDFVDDNNVIDTLAILKLEQRLLDESSNSTLCLNNNVQSYIPISTAWISDATKQKFLKWYERRNRNV